MSNYLKTIHKKKWQIAKWNKTERRDHGRGINVLFNLPLNYFMVLGNSFVYVFPPFLALLIRTTEDSPAMWLAQYVVLSSDHNQE